MSPELDFSHLTDNYKVALQQIRFLIRLNVLRLEGCRAGGSLGQLNWIIGLISTDKIAIVNLSLISLNLILLRMPATILERNQTFTIWRWIFGEIPATFIHYQAKIRGRVDLGSSNNDLFVLILQAHPPGYSKHKSFFILTLKGSISPEIEAPYLWHCDLFKLPQPTTYSPTLILIKQKPDFMIATALSKSWIDACPNDR